MNLNSAVNSHLPLSAAVPLAYALLGEVAEREGIRVVFIKGPTLARQGLREPRTSSDVDAWIDPQRLDDLVAALTKLGWAERPLSVSKRLFTLHSATYIKNGWSCDLDIHDRFPGAFADPSEMFEALWRTRATLELSTGVFPTPDVAHHAVIALLHGLRDPQRRGELKGTLDAVALWPEAERAAFVDAVADMGAAEVLADIVRPLGIELPVPPTPSGEMRVWELRRSDSSYYSVDWMLEMMQAHPKQRLAILRAALFPSQASLAADHGEATESTTQRASLRWQRYLRAVRALPQLGRAFVVARSTDVRSALMRERQGQVRELADVVSRSEPAVPDAAAQPVDPEGKAGAVEAGAGDAPSAEAPSAEAPDQDAVAPVETAEGGNSAVTRGPRVVDVEVDGAYYILNLDQLEASPLIVNAAGAFLWEQVSREPLTVDELVDVVISESDLEPAQVRGDIEGFLTMLRNYRLVS